MSSASSTARWIDCTVDSMLTTTPFFRPREGWLPMPMISSAPSALISPTMRDDLAGADVEADHRLRSARFAMIVLSSLSVRIVAALAGAAAGVPGLRQPMAKPLE